MSRLSFTFFTFVLIACADPRQLFSQTPASTTPRVELTAAPRLRLTGEVDSNSPAVWQRVNGLDQILVMTSMSGRPSVASGLQLERLSVALPVTIDPWPGGGVWMEAVLADVDGALYGYYHNENVATVCPGSSKVIPRIGAARSDDHGLTWTSLGLVLEAAPGSYDCQTTNGYFVGGVGDFSVQLDAESRDLYFFFSQYVRRGRSQGVSVARLAWADRDAPSGKAMVFADSAWLPARSWISPYGMQHWFYPSAVPIMPAVEPWRDEETAVDAFWGPAVHWNVHLEQYVMLLNHAKDSMWTQEGVYVSFSPRLGDPRGWSKPVKILSGGRWYPQVVGLEAGVGTDKVAGRWARFFTGGTSDHLIQFIK